MIPLLGPLLAKPFVASALAFLRAVPREVWYALALLAALWWAYDWAYDRGAASRDAEVALAQSSLVMAQDANEGMQAAIARLQEVNRELAQGRLADREAAQDAVARIEKERDRLARSLAAARRDREMLYERDEYARAWGAARVPDAVLDGLRADAADR